MSSPLSPVVLGVDPGKTTGWALLSIGFECGQLNGRLDAYTRLPLGYPGMEVVAEKFTITPGTPTGQYDALYIIGHLEAICYSNKIPFTLQTPAQAKKFISNEVLTILGWYRKGLPHAMDAARHLALHLVQSGHPVGEMVIEAKKCASA